MAATDSPAISYAQAKAALWAHDQAQVHAVIDGSVMAGLPSRLAEAQCAGWDCLRRGTLAPDVASRMAYLVQLHRDSPFTDWLLGEGTEAFPGWGLLMTSRHSLLAVREHCRELCDVITPDGERKSWRWYDPQLVQVLLPGLAPTQLDEWFALGQTQVLVAAQAWIWQVMEQGLLTTQVRPLLRAAG